MPFEGNTILLATGGFEPQRTNNWLLQINGVPSGANIQGLSTQDFYLALKGFPFPQEVNSVQHIRWYNESRTYAGSVEDFATLNMQVHDYLDKQTAEILYQWRRLVWNPATTAIGVAANYKMSGILFLAPPTAASVADVVAGSRKWYLQGIWPTNVDMGAFDMDATGENVMISCTLACDRAYPGDSDTPDISHVGPQAFNRNI